MNFQLGPKNSILTKRVYFEFSFITFEVKTISPRLTVQSFTTGFLELLFVLFFVSPESHRFEILLSCVCLIIDNENWPISAKNVLRLS